MKKLFICGLAALLIQPAAIAAQQRPGQPDAFAEALFDPQLVLQHAQTIGLTPAQRRTILEEIKAAQTALAPLQVDMTEPALELIELLGTSRVDEARALAKVEQVLRIENEVKKRQTQLLVRVKNALTAEQQRGLRELRKTSQDVASLR
jgi:Spy/CpxP family protein refolding chaperone